MAQFMSSLSNLTTTAGYQLKKHSPEIMIAGGILFGMATTVVSCIATKKAIPIIEDAKNDIHKIMDKIKEEKEYTEEQAKADRRKVYLNTTGKLVKTYALPAGLGIASTACILGGTGILNRRNTSLAAALASTTLGFNEYRERVIKKFGENGEELDSEFRNGTIDLTIEEEVEDKNGKKKKVKTQAKLLPEGERKKLNCDYRRVFDWTNPYWRPDMTYNTTFLRGRQSYFNTLKTTRSTRHVFWNEVLHETGFKKVKEGQTVGWIGDDNESDGDGYIDFRIHEAYAYNDEGVRMPICLLDFNCDGSILEKVDWDYTQYDL